MFACLFDSVDHAEISRKSWTLNFFNNKINYKDVGDCWKVSMVVLVVGGDGGGGGPTGSTELNG
jgi:hypothetical protein